MPVKKRTSRVRKRRYQIEYVEGKVDGKTEQAAKVFPSRQDGGEWSQTELISNDDPRAVYNDELAQTKISVSGEEIQQEVEPISVRKQSNL